MRRQRARQQSDLVVDRATAARVGRRPRWACGHADGRWLRVGRDVRAGMRVLGEGVAEGVREDAQSVVEGLGSVVRSGEKFGQRTTGRPSDAGTDQVI